ncbi:MAG: hypothetical protein IPJ32_08150 [Sphingobacteriaceae bacterium]|nr:hypothetical protein [Sphingobacteriaceae bacterium]
MITSNYVPPSILRILFGENKELPINDDYSIQNWCDELKPQYRRQWEMIRDIPRNKPKKPDNFVFDYETARINPFQIDKNFNNAVKLLEDCYNVKDAVNDLEVKIIDQAALFKISDLLDALSLKEEPVIKRKQTTINNTQTLIYDQVNDKNAKISADISSEDGINQLEIDIINQRREIQKAERKRKEVEFNSLGSPYNLTLKLSRLKAKHTHLLRELTMLVEAIKHGLFIVYKKPPFKLIIDKESLKDSISRYKQEVDLINKFPAERNFKQKNKEEDKEVVELETPIREFLWDTSNFLQTKYQHVDDHIECLSVKKSLRGGMKWEDFLKAAAEGPGPNIGVIKNSFVIDSKNIKLSGIYAEIVLKEGKHAVKISKDSEGKKATGVYEILKKNDSLRSMICKFYINPPQQMLGDNEDYSYRDVGNIVLTSKVNYKKESPLLMSSSQPAFYGGNLIENFSPSGLWILAFEPLEKEDLFIENIEDIHLYLHVKTGGF